MANRLKGYPIAQNLHTMSKISFSWGRPGWLKRIRERELVKTGFIPIKLGEYIDRHLENNPDTSRKEIEEGLQDALGAYKQGVRCECGEPIWVIGSAVVEYSCFTCITGEATPDDDLEIDEAC